MNRWQGLAELTLFLVAAAAGIYGLGRTFQGNTLWLGVSAVALILLAKQMGRVQDHWPRRRASGRQAATTVQKRSNGNEADSP